MITASTILILPIIFAVPILGHELKEAIFDSCIVSENATKEDLNTLMIGILPETRTEKCLAACLSEKFGAVSIKHLMELNQ